MKVVSCVLCWLMGVAAKYIQWYGARLERLSSESTEKICLSSYRYIITDINGEQTQHFGYYDWVFGSNIAYKTVVQILDGITQRQAQGIATYKENS